MADQLTQYYKQHALTLLENGFEPIPIAFGYKYPKGLAGWPSVEITPAQIEAWLSGRYAHAGVGIRTKYSPAVDIDVYNEVIVCRIIKLVEEVTGRQNPLNRIGIPPKVLMPFRTDQPFKKLVSPKYSSPDGWEHRIEILGDGQQFLAYASHPDTKKPYTWEGPAELLDFRQEDLPPLTLEMAQEIIRRFTTEIVPKDWVLIAKGSSADTKKGDDDEDPFANMTRRGDFTIEDLKNDLPVLDPNMGRQDWINVGFGVYHQFAGTADEEEVLTLFDEWSQKGANYVPGEPRRIWPSFKHDPSKSRPITYATVRKMAKGACTLRTNTADIMLPSGPTTYIEAARDIFTRMAEAESAYYRGGMVCEVIEDRDCQFRLAPVTPEMLRSRIEELGPTKAYVKNQRGDYTVALKRPSSESCKGILATKAAAEILSPIESVFASPTLVLADGKPILFTKGYNPHGGGAFVTGGSTIPSIPISEATRALNNLLSIVSG